MRANPIFLTAAEIISPNQMSLAFEGPLRDQANDLVKAIKIIRGDQTIEITDYKIDPTFNHLIVSGDFTDLHTDYCVSYQGEESYAFINWQLMDQVYAYDGPLGVNYNLSGAASFHLWAPTADRVELLLYDKLDPDQLVYSGDMDLDKGVWSLEVNRNTTGIRDHLNYYYHYRVWRRGEAKLCLDPYAKSLARYDHSQGQVAKAAIVVPELIGPQLTYASIDNYTGPEDAIIYEVHVRDFTSDPSLADDLESQPGSFLAFIERLDYLKDLGITHIQLLPVMAYINIDESQAGQLDKTYRAQGDNYNWGYDPLSYFALSGMYCQEPDQPGQRIAAFKELIAAIHDRGMGVILDVVFNHTGAVGLLEDIQPNYYYFLDHDGQPRQAFGGGRLGTTHYMSRRLMLDAIEYWTAEFKVDGFRFDMMGDHDAESIELAHQRASGLNPNTLMIGEGWITYVGDEISPIIRPADQHWMKTSDRVGVFSDEFRDILKSGYGYEGEPRFLSGGLADIWQLFDNLCAQPRNFVADSPRDVVQYIEAHDNLTLHDVLALACQLDPEDHYEEIHRRIRLGNLLVLMSQGISFLHAGQEYGRSKQVINDDYRGDKLDPKDLPASTVYARSADGQPFKYPLFVEDSYRSSDGINKFDWIKLDADQYPTSSQTHAYTRGLIAIRRATDAFSHKAYSMIQSKMRLIPVLGIRTFDRVIAYQATDSQQTAYSVLINADNQERSLTLAAEDAYILKGEVLADGAQAGLQPISQAQGIEFGHQSITLAPLTGLIVRNSY